MQDDLKISRKTRRSEKEEDAITFLEELKTKAKKFYEQKMTYIFCPKCNTLLATMWFMYPDYKSNMIKLKCHRDLGDGLMCDGEVSITSQWLLENGMRNKKDIPESMR
jgi:RNase P subunit RPR2